ncbi:MAG TPA: hypothetical protein VFX51_14140 [Solirubrobacteraceae bacterium]|nr:hypothetical protein [Solirubrobacteraceae bacterium]
MRAARRATGGSLLPSDERGSRSFASGAHCARSSQRHWFELYAAAGPIEIELLSFDGCSSREAFESRLRELLAEAGVDVQIRRRRVESDAAANRARFLGSPTLRVDGVDVEPGAGDRSDYGVKCRLYPTEQGLRGVPPDEWVLHALRHAG